MEEQFNFQIDFDNLSTTVPVLETPENVISQEANSYIETIQDGKKVYMCTALNCGKAFKFLSQATRHVIIHKEDRPYQCTVPGCNKSFKRADVLENHMQLHTGTENLPYACDRPECDRKFASKAALSYHQTAHDNNRVFKCDFEECGKSFLLASQLKQHKKAVNYHYDDLPPTKRNREIWNPYDPNDPEMKREFQKMCAAPCEQAQWKEMTKNCKRKLSDEILMDNFRILFNYLISENKILKEQKLKDEKPPQAKDNSTTCSTALNSCSDLTRLSEHFDSEELRLLEFLKQRGDDDF